MKFQHKVTHCKLQVGFILGCHNQSLLNGTLYNARLFISCLDFFFCVTFLAKQSLNIISFILSISTILCPSQQADMSL